jgi:hypothetical protein
MPDTRPVYRPSNLIIQLVISELKIICMITIDSYPASDDIMLRVFGHMNTSETGRGMIKRWPDKSRSISIGMVWLFQKRF